MDVLFSSMSVYTASMTAPVTYTVAVVALLIVAATAIASLVSRKIRRISAYALVTE
jgi:hypothetical protein